MASVSYISASANRFPQVGDISPSALVAFGSSKLIALWDIADQHERGVLQTLPGHGGLVTCVCFAGGDTFFSADEKGELRCWRKTESQWISTTKVQAHKSGISSLCFLNKCLVTGSSDASVKIWTVNVGGDADKIEEVQVLPLHGNYPLSLALAFLPQSEAIILAIGGTDRNIRIWTRSENVFVPSIVLSGHEDWVRCLAFRAHASQGAQLNLASGSQDATIRLWKIATSVRGSDDKPKEALRDDFLADFEASLGNSTDGGEGAEQMSLKRHLFSVKHNGRSQQFSATFDALLVGHEAGVTSLRWRSTCRPISTSTLLSTSTDASLILWSPSVTTESSEDGASSIWISRQRFGDIGGQRLGGFVCGLWAREGMEALASGWGGGWRRWRCASQSEGVDEDWVEVPGVSGHRGPVKGLDWSPRGEYLISSGLDQSTRIHGEITVADRPTTAWHELGRPQIHGYDLLGVKFLSALKFVSIADEKVARVFEAPRNFVTMIEDMNVANFSPAEHERPLAATVAPLGLSNKAVDEDSQATVIHEKNTSSPIPRRPLEGDLTANTLWPEIEKVFGHGYELISLTVSHSRRLIATACKATTAEHAVVRIYDTDKWKLVGKPLEGHSLTVTQIAFSPDDRLVLSVSRDRSWRIFQCQADGGYLPLVADKSHGRIIWDCAWAHEGDIFATASRDKTVKIWKASDTTMKKWTAVATIAIKESGATAVSFSPLDVHDCRRLAIGLETGQIHIYRNGPSTPSDWLLVSILDSSITHCDPVHRLAWRPINDTTRLQLASCSEDGTVKILTVQTASVNDHP